MRLAVALAASAVLLFGTAQPVSAAPSATLELSPRTVVVGPSGVGAYATFSALGVPGSVRAIDLDLYGPGDDRVLVDLSIRDRPGIWEGDYKFNRFDESGKWKAVLTMRDRSGRSTKGGTLYFHVKRRTTLSGVSSKSRNGGVSGVLRKMTASGTYKPYVGQKVRLYRWNGGWTYVTTDVTDAKGRYSFKAFSGTLQIRYAGTSINAASVRTMN